jgi:zinc transport system substrate-binding protein
MTRRHTIPAPASAPAPAPASARTRVSTGRHRFRRRFWGGLALALCLAETPPARAAAEPNEPNEASEASEALGVVVSILPLHGLVTAVMAGVGSPHLLVRGGASPHDASLRPSDARALSAARLVVWAGPGLEAFLVKPLRALAGAARVLTLAEAPGMVLLKQRAGGAFEAEAGGEGDRGHAESVNPHLWLDPRNAIEIARRVAAALAGLDPGNAPRYAANLARLVARLEALDRELAARLGPLAGIPFAVFHDAYPYLEARYGLRALGALTVNPAVPPGAKRLAALRARLRELGATCVFAEPQFRPAVVAALVEGTGARAATLDPLGAGLAPGPEAYFVLMRELADGLAACLARRG